MLQNPVMKSIVVAILAIFVAVSLAQLTFKKASRLPSKLHRSASACYYDMKVSVQECLDTAPLRMQHKPRWVRCCTDRWHKPCN